MDDPYEGTAPEYIMDGVRIVRASRQPCIICGHPTGDCTDFPEAPLVVFGEKVKTAAKREPDVFVPEDIYGEKQITPFTRARVLLAAKGTYVPADKAQELGLL